MGHRWVSSTEPNAEAAVTAGRALCVWEADMCPGKGGLHSAAVYTSCFGSCQNLAFVLRGHSEKSYVFGDIFELWSPVTRSWGVRTISEMTQPRLVPEGGCFLIGILATITEAMLTLDPVQCPLS